MDTSYPLSFPFTALTSSLGLLRAHYNNQISKENSFQINCVAQSTQQFIAC
jgi:hypothetical protein